jgi:hypothetical protein
MPKKPKDQALVDHDFSVESANLIQMWTNAESWFVHILAMLIRCDLKRADLLFFSFTSTRARIDLIRRGLQYPRDTRHLFKMASSSMALHRLETRYAMRNITLDPASARSLVLYPPTISEQTLTA